MRAFAFAVACSVILRVTDATKMPGRIRNATPHAIVYRAGPSTLPQPEADDVVYAPDAACVPEAFRAFQDEANVCESIEPGVKCVIAMPYYLKPLSPAVLAALDVQAGDVFLVSTLYAQALPPTSEEREALFGAKVEFFVPFTGPGPNTIRTATGQVFATRVFMRY